MTQPRGLSHQIMQMLLDHPPDSMSMAEFKRLDRTLETQRRRHGDTVTAWWFWCDREYWLARAEENESGRTAESA